MDNDTQTLDSADITKKYRCGHGVHGVVKHVYRMTARNAAVEIIVQVPVSQIKQFEAGQKVRVCCEL